MASEKHLFKRDDVLCMMQCADVNLEQMCFDKAEQDNEHLQYDYHLVRSPADLKLCKRVHFADKPGLAVVHKIIAWDYAYRAARKGPWEQFARDREHFKRRICNLASILEPCLAKKLVKGSNLCQF